MHTNKNEFKIKTGTHTALVIISAQNTYSLLAGRCTTDSLTRILARSSFAGGRGRSMQEREICVDQWQRRSSGSDVRHGARGTDYAFVYVRSVNLCGPEDAMNMNYEDMCVRSAYRSVRPVEPQPQPHRPARLRDVCVW